MSDVRNVVVGGPFDDIRSGELCFLEKASHLGRLTVLLWPDETIERITGCNPKFPLAERRYFLDAVRYVDKVVIADAVDRLPEGIVADIWSDYPPTASPLRANYCLTQGLIYYPFASDELCEFPAPPDAPPSKRRTVVVTGCFDWLHSGHVRFFEEVSQYGDLTVILGHDENIRLLKGEGHPLQPQDERRYAVGAIKYVKRALISSGSGWLDADPEIQQLKPDIYAVNEDGDKGGKREYCQANGIEYLVLERAPASGLPRRSSTDLRGF